MMNEMTNIQEQISLVVAKSRKSAGMTQSDLSKATGIAQGDISKIERAEANPSLNTLKRLAAGMNMTLKIEFLPIANQ